MFRRNFTLQRLRSVVAEHGRNFDYNLEQIVSHSRKQKIPIHVKYPASSTRSTNTTTTSSKRGSGGIRGTSPSTTPASGGGGSSSATTMSEAATGSSSNPLQMLVLEPLEGKHVGVFPDGSAVCFDCTTEDVAKIREEFKSCEIPAEMALVAPKQVVKHHQYTLLSELESLGYEAPAPHSYIDEGPLNAIVLEDDEPRNKLPYMTCFGELIQIEALDSTLGPVTTKVGKWQTHTKLSGLLSCSLNDVRMCRAQVSRIQERQTAIDNRQKIFWQEGYTHLRSTFNDAYETWEVSARNGALKTKAGSMANSVAYFSEETHALTNHRLEWVIIVIIFLCLMNAVLVGH